MHRVWVQSCWTNTDVRAGDLGSRLRPEYASQNGRLDAPGVQLEADPSLASLKESRELSGGSPERVTVGGRG